MQSLGLGPRDTILLPETICDVVMHPLESLGLGVRFYTVGDDLAPDWTALENSLAPDVRALLIVHYFGQPQDIRRFQAFCAERGLFLIEDNAHGHGGTFEGQALGTFGDMGISSPRKFVNTYCGGLLWLRGTLAAPEGNLAPFPLSLRRSLQQKVSLRDPGLIRRVKRSLGLRPRFDDPRASMEAPIEDYAVDRESVRVLDRVDWDTMKRARQEAYRAWEGLTSQRGLVPLYPALHPEANPWCFPAYAHDSDEANRMCLWGWQNGAVVFRWPALPEELIAQDGVPMERWRRLLCFSTASPPPAGARI